MELVMRLPALSIKQRLYFGFSLALTLTTFLGVFSIVRLARVAESSSEIENHWLPSSRLAEELKTLTDKLQNDELHHLLSDASEQGQIERAQIEKAMSEKLLGISALVKEYRALIRSEEEGQFLAEFEKTWQAYLARHQIIVSLSRAGQKEEARREVQGRAQESFGRASKAIDRLVEFNTKGGIEASRQGDLIYSSSRLNIILQLLMSLVIGVAQMYFQTRGISSQLTRVLRKLDGDSTEVAMAAKEISSTSEHLSERTSDQSVSLQQTSSAVEQISAVVQHNVENAARSRDLADQSHRSALDGEKVVDEMIRAVGEMKQGNASILAQVETGNLEMTAILGVINEIGDKTKVINEIVFQTKLLAFNASVEAARAGSAGMGFAVVAEEIGKLARMSGDASQDISTMLARSIDQVNKIVNESRSRMQGLMTVGERNLSTCTEISQKCGQVLEQIVENVVRVNHMAGEIATSSNEQAKGVREVLSAIHNLNEATRQNAKASGDATRSAQGLDHRAASLKSLVAELKTIIEGHKLGPLIGNNSQARLVSREDDEETLTSAAT